MLTPRTMSSLDSAEAAVQYLKGTLLQDGWSEDPRSGEQIFGRLQEEFKNCPKAVQEYVRAALNICLRELQNHETDWYKPDNDEYCRAEELMLFANDDGNVVTSLNRGEVLGLIEAIPGDIDDRIAHPRKEVRKRCVQTIVGLLTDDEPSREFIARRKEEYSLAYWERESENVMMQVAGIEHFHGTQATYDWALQHVEVEGILVALTTMITVSHRKDEWRVLFVEKSAGEASGAEGAVLKAVKDGLELEEKPV